MENYIAITTEFKVGETTKTVWGRDVKEQLKEKINFLVPTMQFFAPAFENLEESYDDYKDEYTDPRLQWVWDAVVSKARATLASRITTEGKIAWKSPYKPWNDFDTMIAVLGRRRKLASAELLKAFITDFTAFILTLGKSEKFVSQRIELISNKDKLAAQNETVRSKVAEILGIFFSTLTEEEKGKYETVFGDLMATCNPEILEDLAE